jgi:hypothetical protein
MILEIIEDTYLVAIQDQNLELSAVFKRVHGGNFV